MNRKALASITLLALLGLLVAADATLRDQPDANIGLGLLGLAIFGLSATLAMTALSEIKRTGESGRVAAWLSLLIIGAWTFVFLVVPFL